MFNFHKYKQTDRLVHNDLETSWLIFDRGWGYLGIASKLSDGTWVAFNNRADRYPTRNAVAEQLLDAKRQIPL